ncbi:MAG: LemA family protein [Halanaerobiales bacterium]
MTSTTIALLAALISPLLIFIFIYNSLIASRNRVEEAFSGIDVQLKKRYDLIPNLISTVKQYMEHEQQVLTEITELRSKAVNGDLSTKEEFQLNNELSDKLKGLNVVVEAYPDLKADESFDNLQRSLNEVESQISAARRTYNANVRAYNNKVEQFPSSLVASMKGFDRHEFFRAAKKERENVDVDNLFE